MRQDILLECEIFEYIDLDADDVTVQVHLKDKEIVVFHHVLTDPTFYRGWFSIEHDVFGTKMTSMMRESEVSYISYYIKSKEMK